MLEIELLYNVHPRNHWKNVQKNYVCTIAFSMHICLIHGIHQHALDLHPFNHPRPQYTCCCKCENMKDMVGQFTHTLHVALETYAKERPFSLNKILAWKQYLNNTKRIHGGHEIDNIFRKCFMQIYSLMAWHKSHIFYNQSPICASQLCKISKGDYQVKICMTKSTSPT